MKAKPKKNAPKRGKKPSTAGVLWRGLLGLLLVTGLVLAAGAYVLLKPLKLNHSPLDVQVQTGQGARAIGESLAAQGAGVWPELFVLVARATGQIQALKAGRYPLEQGINHLGLVKLLGSGKGSLSTVTVVEGTSAKTIINQWARLPDLQNDLPSLDPLALAATFQVEGGSLEGWLYPDTYKYAPGSKLSQLLRRAIALQQEALTQAWAQRDPKLQLKSPYEALIMASIVEKETGKASDRPLISSVFNNRLKAGMMLQTDPTVIYGVGDAFDGNLTRLHLQTDTAYNTYTRRGLPPTPIANPGVAALYAAVRPEETPYYYFVAKGDGSSHFSKNLDEHNRAVRQYILKAQN